MITFILNLFLKEKPNDKESLPPKSNQANYQSLTPGTSTKEDVLDKLGKPVAEEENGGILNYSSSSSERPHQVVLEENNIKLIKEIVTLRDEKKTIDIQNVYGKPKNVLYGDRSSAGFHLFIYPENGIAYIGQAESGLLLEVWYFPPTTFELFKTTYASEYSLTLQQSQ